QLSPNSQVNYPFGEGGPPNFVIRGISSTDYSANQSKPIAIYIDEGIRGLSTFETMPLFDVERVEVLRGPQGTLYGKNATGGAVNIVTKK
ncbi:TonB-dependent receptor plug domain-containing protein, partial [Acinetobacter baumannii]